MEFLFWCAVAVLASEYGKHYEATKDGSIEGFVEYLKTKYYKKRTQEEPKKYEPKPGSNAHYEAWRAERMKEKER